MSNVYRQNDTFRLVSSKLQIDVLPKVFANAISKAFLGLHQSDSLVSIHYDTSSPSDGLHRNLGLQLANLPQTTVTFPNKWVEATFVACLYFNSTKAFTWEEANMTCQVQNSTLLVITSEE